MKAILFILIYTFFASCSLFRKSVNTVKQESSKSTLSKKDSVGLMSIELIDISRIETWGRSTIDSGYDKVTDEVIKDYGDSVFTVRTIKEKGQKRVEQAGRVIKYDSGAAMITEHSRLQELQQEDSSSAVVTVQKDVKRAAFLPWWLWLIAAIPVAVCLYIWKRNSIVKLFT